MLILKTLRAKKCWEGGSRQSNRTFDAVAVNYKTYKTIRLFYKTDFEAKIILLKESYSLLPIL